MTIFNKTVGCRAEFEVKAFIYFQAFTYSWDVKISCPARVLGGPCKTLNPYAQSFLDLDS